MGLLGSATKDVIGGMAGIAGGIIGSRGRKRELRQAKKEYETSKADYFNQDTSNLYANMENTMEDLTVNTQQAEFASQQQNQALAATMNGMQGAAGGSGIAALAQAIAGQQSQNLQQASISIGQQEQANQMAERRMASSIQQQEIAGENQSRSMKADLLGTQLGMAQNRLGAAKEAKAAATQSIIGGVSGILGAGVDVAEASMGGGAGGAGTLTDSING
jgi:hypothetical protein